MFYIQEYIIKFTAQGNLCDALHLYKELPTYINYNTYVNHTKREWNKNDSRSYLMNLCLKFEICTYLRHIVGKFLIFLHIL